MRVLFVNETCGTGSNGKLAKDLAVAIEENGGESLIAFANGGANFHRAYHIGNTLDHKTHAILSRLTGLQGYYSVGATNRLVKVIEEFNPDVVHLHNLHGNYVNLPVLLRYLAKRNIATVLTLHDCWYFTGKCTHYIMSACQKWQSVCGQCPRLHLDNVNPTFFFDSTRKCFLDKKKLFAAIPRLGVVGVSQWITGEAKKSFFMDREPCCIYNWVDNTIFYPRNNMILDQTRFNILFVASHLTTNKGYNVMVELAKMIPEDWAITVIGRTTLPIPKGVCHIERTYDQNELAKYYSSANVCINTTVAETFGLVTAESICCGTPVIVYDNTASPELVANGCGFVVKQKDGIAAVFEALKVLYSSNRDFYRNNCILSADRFSKQKGTSAYIAFYNWLLRQEEK